MPRAGPWFRPRCVEATGLVPAQQDCQNRLRILPLILSPERASAGQHGNQAEDQTVRPNARNKPIRPETAMALLRQAEQRGAARCA